MTRNVKTFEHRPVEHILECETVDFDSRSFSFVVFGEADPALVTVVIGTEQRTLSRVAMKEGFQRILDAIDKVPAQPKGGY